MELRKAVPEDLPQLQAMYREIVRRMQCDGLSVWDEVYPCEFLGEDIAQHRLYVLTRPEGDIAAAFALCGGCDGARHVQWQEPQAAALYLDRLGVNIAVQRQGAGTEALQKAAALAGAQGAAYLRLFVVEGNGPAQRLYEKNGFRQAGGFYDEHVDEDLVLREFGFEKRFEQACLPVPWE